MSVKKDVYYLVELMHACMHETRYLLVKFCKKIMYVIEHEVYML